MGCSTLDFKKTKSIINPVLEKILPKKIKFLNYEYTLCNQF